MYYIAEIILNLAHWIPRCDSYLDADYALEIVRASSLYINYCKESESGRITMLTEDRAFIPICYAYSVVLTVTEERYKAFHLYFDFLVACSLQTPRADAPAKMEFLDAGSDIDDFKKIYHFNEKLLLPDALDGLTDPLTGPSTSSNPLHVAISKYTQVVRSLEGQRLEHTWWSSPEHLKGEYDRALKRLGEELTAISKINLLRHERAIAVLADAELMGVIFMRPDDNPWQDYNVVAHSKEDVRYKIFFDIGLNAVEIDKQLGTKKFYKGEERFLKVMRNAIEKPGSSVNQIFHEIKRHHPKHSSFVDYSQDNDEVVVAARKKLADYAIRTEKRLKEEEENREKKEKESKVIEAWYREKAKEKAKAEEEGEGDDNDDGKDRSDRKDGGGDDRKGGGGNEVEGDVQIPKSPISTKEKKKKNKQNDRVNKARGEAKRAQKNAEAQGTSGTA